MDDLRIFHPVTILITLKPLADLWLEGSLKEMKDFFMKQIFFNIGLFS